MARGTVVVKFVGDDRGLRSAAGNVDKDLSKVGASAKRSSENLHKVGTAVKVGLVGALGAAGVVLKTGFSELSDYQAGLAQAKAVIKSTGGEANVSAGHVESLASSIQGYSGMADDAVVTGENMLLTFTGIRNEVGKGNDIFDQATKTVADMSQALGQDTKSSAIQLGKALNDPIKGVTALQRVGVSFTQSQKDQIKALVDSGRTMDAQKLILGELNKEFGGSAKAYGKTLPGQLAIAKRHFEDVTQSIAQALLPVFVKLTGFLVDDVIPAVKGVADFLGKYQGILLPLAAAIGTLVVGWKVYKAITTAVAAAQEALNLVMEANPIGLIVIALAALAVGLVVAYKRSETFRAVVHKALTVVGTAFGVLKKVAEAVLGFIKAHWKLVATIIATLVGGPIVGALVLFGTHLGTIKSIAGDVWHGIKDTFGKIVGFVTGLPGKIAHAAKGMWDGIANEFIDAINAIIGVWNKLHFHFGGKKIAGHTIIPGFDFGLPQLPTIPAMAAGGIVTKPTVALVGEAGPEAVVPLGRHGATAALGLADHAKLLGEQNRLIGELIETHKRQPAELERFFRGWGIEVVVVDGTGRAIVHRRRAS